RTRSPSCLQRTAILRSPCQGRTNESKAGHKLPRAVLLNTNGRLSSTAFTARLTNPVAARTLQLSQTEKAGPVIICSHRVLQCMLQRNWRLYGSARLPMVYEAAGTERKRFPSPSAIVGWVGISSLMAV